MRFHAQRRPLGGTDKVPSTCPDAARRGFKAPRAGNVGTAMSNEGALVQLLPPNADGISVLKFTRARKLNGWNRPMLAQIRAAFDAASTDDAVKAVIITGSGRYYSAGAAFAEMIGPMMPSTLLKMAEEVTFGIFDDYLSFKKPLFAAVNGPAIGGGCTSLLHSDVVIASSRAIFSTPFRQLGLPNEGCSPLTFPAKMGQAGAAKMLDEGQKLTAKEAKELGFVDVLVEDEAEELSASGDPAAADSMLLVKAHEVAKAWLAAEPEKRQRRPSHGKTDEFRAKNRAEARELALTLVQPSFIDAQYRLAKAKNKPTWAFGLAKVRCIMGYGPRCVTGWGCVGSTATSFLHHHASGDPAAARCGRCPAAGGGLLRRRRPSHRPLQIEPDARVLSVWTPHRATGRRSRRRWRQRASARFDVTETRAGTAPKCEPAHSNIFRTLLVSLSYILYIKRTDPADGRPAAYDSTASDSKFECRIFGR